MKSRSKTLGKKILASTAALALAGTILATGISAPLKTFALSDANGKWYTDFGSYAEEQEYARSVAVDIVAESMVLMKNNGVLPLAKSVKNVSLFGARSYDPVIGGTGSGSSSGAFYTLPQSLENAGYKVNGRVKALYENNKVNASVVAGMGSSTAIVDPDVSILDSAKSSYVTYGDAAIFTIGRSGGEGADLLTNNLPTHADKTDHVLELDDNEKAALEHIKENFDKVIILVNCANVFELGELQNDPAIDAIVWIGQPGQYGFEAVGQVLNGNVNPSGRTVDIYPADFKKDPTWFNFGTMQQVNDIDPETGKYEAVYNTRTYTKGEDGTLKQANTYTLEYEEGIYLGYKYYETAAVEGFIDYEEAVVYPFGYGLSYTTFDQEIVTSDADIAAAINAANGLDAKIDVQVKVTNTGDVAGKEVAQLYVHAPYTEGEIEKAEVSFVSFAKTDILQPGESQVLTLKVRIGDLASFDYNDANKNNYKGWELEDGSYELRLQANSHDVLDVAKIDLSEKKEVLDNDSDPENNTPLSNGDDYDSLLNVKEEGSQSTMKIMSRADFEGTFPTPATNEERVYGTVTTTLLTNSNATVTTNDQYTRYTAYYNSSDDLPTDPWYKTNEDIPAGWTQAANTEGRVDGKTAIQLKEMAGLDYWDDETVIEGGIFDGKTHAEAWEIFMNQLTYAEMTSVLSSGRYQTPALASVGKDKATDQDGPAQLKGGTRNDTLGTNWPCEVNISSTYNVELAHKQGLCLGNESLYLDVPGWYAPAMNTHRSPFSGRNFEYYSQDATQGGIIAAAVCSGAESKGCYVYIKHFGLNDQETNRTGTGTFADEQTIRENYFKDFEYAVKDGHASAVMTAFNRVGAINEFANYMTVTQIMRYEWGFKGQGVTDYYSSGLAKANYLQRGGCEMPLGSFSGTNAITGTWDPALRDGKGGVRDGDAVDGVMPESATQYVAIRECATRVMWVGANTNVNENGLNKSLFAAKTIDIFAGATVNTSIAVDAEAYGTDENVYAVTGGALPAGLEMKTDGTISGTSTECGTYRVTVTLTSDGWATASAQITINVKPTASVEVGEAINTQVEGRYKIGDGWSNNATRPITAITYTLRNETYGLSISEDGTLTGTITTPGTYAITVRQNCTYTQNGSNRTGTADSTIYIVVTGEVVEVDNNVYFQVVEGKLQYKLGAEGEWSNIAAEAPETGVEFRVENGVLQFQVAGGEWTAVSTGSSVGAQGPVGATGATGPMGPQGANGEDGKDGADGKGILDVEINSSGELIIIYTDGVRENVGKVVGETGAQGPQGVQGEKGEQGEQGEAGAGCGGVIGIGSAAVAASLILGAAVVLRKKED